MAIGSLLRRVASRVDLSKAVVRRAMGGDLLDDAVQQTRSGNEALQDPGRREFMRQGAREVSDRAGRRVFAGAARKSVGSVAASRVVTKESAATIVAAQEGLNAVDDDGVTAPSDLLDHNKTREIALSVQNQVFNDG